MSDIANELAQNAARLFGSYRQIAGSSSWGFSNEFPQLLWDQISGGGWSDALLREDGGLALTYPDLGLVFTEIGRHLVPVPLFAHLVAVPILLGVSDNEEAKEHMLGCIRGASKASIADPHLDADRRRRLQAPVVHRDRISGTIPYIMSPDWADYLIVFQPEMVCLVPVDLTNVTYEMTVGADRVTRYGLAHMKRAPFIPITRAMDIVPQIRDAARLLSAFELLGIAEEIVDMSVDYAIKRHQFGRPIGSFQAVKHILADCSVRLLSLRSLCLEASHETAHVEEKQRALSSNVVKAYASLVIRNIAEDCLQVHGGIGFTEEHRLHVFMKRALTLQGYYGDEKELEHEIGRQILAEGSALQA